MANVEAAVAKSFGGKPVIPQETITLIDVGTKQEAHYITVVINSRPFKYAATAYSQEGGKSMGTPGILENLRIPRFNPKDKLHLRLSELSEAAHRATAAGDAEQVARIEAEIDHLAARLWGLTEKELQEVQLAMEELR